MTSAPVGNFSSSCVDQHPASEDKCEAAIKISGVPKELQIVALDARGKALAMTKPVRAR